MRIKCVVTSVSLHSSSYIKILQTGFSTMESFTSSHGKSRISVLVGLAFWCRSSSDLQTAEFVLPLLMANPLRSPSYAESFLSKQFLHGSRRTSHRACFPILSIILGHQYTILRKIKTNNNKTTIQKSDYDN